MCLTSLTGAAFFFVRGSQTCQLFLAEQLPTFFLIGKVCQWYYCIYSTPLQSTPYRKQEGFQDMGRFGVEGEHPGRAADAVLAGCAVKTSQSTIQAAEDGEASDTSRLLSILHGLCNLDLLRLVQAKFIFCCFNQL